MFARSDDDLGCTNAVRHRIRTVDDIPVVTPYRRIPTTQLDEVKQHLQQLLRNGTIVESNSDYASAIVLVRKKSGALRLCVDYRALNAKTIKDAHPLLRIEQSMDALKGARWFSTLDLQSAYNQVRMHPDDQHKTAFSSPLGLHEYTRMPFGLSNTPGTYQRLMQSVFREELFNSLLNSLLGRYTGILDDRCRTLGSPRSRLHQTPEVWIEVSTEEMCVLQERGAVPGSSSVSGGNRHGS